MKALTAFAMLLALGATAQAKFAPFEGAAIAIASHEMAIAIGPVGALLEADYFRAPQSPIATERIFPCRLRHIVFDKTRLAQSCR